MPNGGNDAHASPEPGGEDRPSGDLVEGWAAVPRPWNGRSDGRRVLRDRREAGRWLAERLWSTISERPIVLGLPRGGVPVGAEIADRLAAPLDVLVARKVAAPNNPEYALGALAEAGGRLLDVDRIRQAGLTPHELEKAIRRESEAIGRQVGRFRAGHPLPDVRGRTVIVVDDGVATGATMIVAARVVRALAPHRLVLATGVCPESAIPDLRREADEIVALLVPRHFLAVGDWYTDFPPVSDAEVERLLGAHPRAPTLTA